MSAASASSAGRPTSASDCLITSVRSLLPSLWMRVPIAVYSGASTSAPCACSAAMATRTGPNALANRSRYSSGRPSRFSLSTARLITWKFTSMSRTFSTSRIQREVIHAHGHSGSNQKSALFFAGACCAMADPLVWELLVELKD